MAERLTSMNRSRLALALLLLAALPAAAAEPTWVERSNENAQVLLDVQARFAPEQAGAVRRRGARRGGLRRCRSTATAQVLQRRRRRPPPSWSGRLAAERDPAVRQDLEILIDAGEAVTRGLALEREVLPARLRPAADGLPGHPRSARRPGAEGAPPGGAGAPAQVRRRRAGHTPLADQADRLAARPRSTSPRLLRPPFKDDLERQLGNSARFVDGDRRAVPEVRL